MQIFVARNGTREGPYTAEELAEKSAQGLLGATDLFWHEGRPDWSPLSQFPSFIPPPPRSDSALPVLGTPQPEQVAVSGPQIRPWVRYFARMLDLYIFAFCLGMLLAWLAPGLLKAIDNRLLIGMLFAGLWCLVEPIFMTTWHTTPAKALLGVTVRNSDGTCLDFDSALGRSFQVWIRGMGIGIPLLSLITLSMAYERLTKHGAASWDAENGFTVSHRLIGPLRITCALLIGVTFLVAAIVGTLHPS